MNSAGDPACAPIAVTVAWSPRARQVCQRALKLAPGSTVRDALADAGVLDLYRTDYADDPRCLGIWGRRVTLAQALQAGDRVELWRPLRVDPKRARRERFDRQGARSAGLFAQRRPGAKSGY